MIVERTSIYSGKTRTKDLPITQAQLDRWDKGELIQNVFPNLSADDREFLITGMTEEEWNDLFADTAVEDADV